MNATKYYIELLRSHTTKNSDYAIAKLLNVSRSTMTKYKQGRSSIDSDQALKVGQILGINPLVIVAECKANNSKNIDNMQHWKRLAEALKKTSLTLAILPTLFILIYSQLIDSNMFTIGNVL